ncbi:MAG: DUF1178 family protein [Hyphomicrobiaceae bacterium]
MIKYQLVCEREHAFESWFANSSAYDKAERAGLLACATCGSTKVRKAIMAPNVSVKTRQRGESSAGRQVASDAEPTPAATVPAPHPTSPPQQVMAGPPAEQVAKVVAFMRALRAAVEATAEDVGDRFADEARKMHYGDADERAIFGEATLAETIDLIEEGIEIVPLPALPEDHN